MGNINAVIIEGNIVKNAELSRWPNGTPYCKFTIAHNKSYKDKDGNWIDIGNFFDCKINGNYAESMFKYLLKGKHLTVEGELSQNRWKDEAGNSHSMIGINVSKVSFAPGSFQPKEGGQQGGSPSFNQNNQQNYEQSQGEYYPPADENFSDSEIPF
ncbi:MAG: single-stranded DNA-binding protein [Methanobrevibacter sp.]|nr:single-stranded DNA-binding protein [Methanobrevibacter sp.]